MLAAFRALFAGAFLKNRALGCVMTGALAACAALLIGHGGVLDSLEDATWGWRARFFADSRRPSSAIKLILLDQQSLDWAKKQLGLTWPWPREVYAPIIDFCTRHGARAVIFDVIYSEPSAVSVEDDRKLEEAIKRAPFFIGAFCLHREAGFSKSWPAYIPDRPFIKKNSFKQFLSSPSVRPLLRASATFPIPEVAAHAGALANVIAEPDVDGVFRRVNLFQVFAGRAVASPGFAAYALRPAKRSGDGGAAAQRSCAASLDKDRLRIFGRNIPLDTQGRLILRFHSQGFSSYSAAAVIQSEINAEAGQREIIADGKSFKDAYVFFGFSAPGLADVRATPLESATPGVEIHAALLDNLLAGDFLQDVSPLTAALSTLLLAIAAAVFVASLATRAWQSVLGIALFAPMPAAIGFAAYPLGFRWPVAVQELAVAGALTGALVLNYATEGRKRAFIKKAFRQYLSPAVIERILEDPSRLNLGGERKELTIFFSDMQGFSTISEALDPVSLTKLLNLILSDMSDIILDEGGTLDKYEGDAIIAFWNAPMDQPDHAERACRAALRCQDKIRQKRLEYENAAGAPIRMRIGINTGPVVVGNMGSASRFDYTVLGDAANLASRLEGANKFFGTNIMVSEQTWARTANRFRGRRLGFVRVVGRGRPVEVFEPLGFEPGADSRRESFERAMDLCLDKNWKEALELFETLPDDHVAGLYAARCRAILQDCDGDWDGVWDLESK